MAGSETWAGWVRLAATLMLIIASIDFFQGLIAIIRGSYYTLTPNQIIVFDISTWGWLTLLWSVVLFATGFGLGTGASWARAAPGTSRQAIVPSRHAQCPTVPPERNGPRASAIVRKTRNFALCRELWKPPRRRRVGAGAGQFAR